MIKEIFSRLRAFRWQKLLIIWAVFVAIAAILFAERSGIKYEATKFKINYLPRTEVKSAQIAMFGQPVTCLLLYDSGQEGTDLAKKQFDQILLDMKVSTQAVDVHTTSLADIPEFDQYKTVVVLISDLDALGKRLIDLMNWVKDGGSVLFAMAPQKTTYFDAISPKLGILSSSWENKIAESIVPTEEFMLGGGQRYEFSDPFESSLSVSLREEATVYASTGDEGVPLVWGTKSGAGRVVVDNIGVYDKIMRGIYAASFSLLCDAAAYPVINSSVFYLDDFPSPVPGGDGTYIRRDYRMSIQIMGKATLQTMPMWCSGLRITVCFMRWRSFWARMVLFPMWSWAALATGASGTSKAKMVWYPCRMRRSGTNMPQIILRLFLRQSC